MRKINPKVIAAWSTVLLVSLIFAIFILPVLPYVWQKMLLRILYSIIYLSAILCLNRRTKPLLVLFFSTVIIEWGSGILGFPSLLLIAKCINIIFFIVIIFLLIRQIATSKKVTLGVILDSVSGYLLLGLIYSIAILFIIQTVPGAFSYPINGQAESSEGFALSIPLYFSFVTMATLGYGDMVPVESSARSLSIFIAVSGQFYIAIIVALLVGKFSTQQNTGKDE
jgi:voltage-gated potassium channel